MIDVVRLNRIGQIAIAEAVVTYLIKMVSVFMGEHEPSIILAIRSVLSLYVLLLFFRLIWIEMFGDHGRFFS